MSKTINQEQYDSIKLLNKSGVKAPVIANTLGYSTNAIYAILKTDTLEEHKNNNKQRLAKYKKANQKASENEVGIETEAKDSIAKEYKMPELERIAIALENLVTAWETTKDDGKKKGWLK